MKIYTVILILLIITFSCKTKQNYSFAPCALINSPNIKSTVTKLKLTGIADTTIAYISGFISGKEKKKHKAVALPGSSIELVDKQSQVKFQTVSNEDGSYKLQLSAGTYDIEVSGMDFNNIIIRDVKIGTGYMIKLDVILGNAGENGNSSIYQMKEDRSLVEIQQK